MDEGLEPAMKRPILYLIAGGLISIAILGLVWEQDIQAGVAIGGLISIANKFADSEEKSKGDKV